METKGAFTWREGVLVFLAFIGVQLGSEVMNQWGTYFYSPSDGSGRTIYVSIGLVGIIFIAGTIWDAITDPLVGSWSDRTKMSRAKKMFLAVEGKRRPFIFWGSILSVVTSIAFWFPPVEGVSSLNLVYGTVLVCLHWTVFTVTVVPLQALTLDIARTEAERVKMGTWVALGFIVGLAVANALTGVLIELLDTAEKGAVTSPVGYRRIAVIYALFSLAVFQLLVWRMKEPRRPARQEQDTEPLLKGLGSALKNRAFVVYFTGFLLFTAGFLGVQRILPYWAELGLGGNEATVTVLLGPFIVTALLSYTFIPALARRLHVKWMIIVAFLIICTGMPLMYWLGVVDLPSSTKIAVAAGLFAYCGIGRGFIYVMMTPAIGDIIDHDEARTGRRREALYNGLSGVAWKASMAFSILIATQSMSIWGNSVTNFMGVLYVGPIAAGLALVGVVVMLFYPGRAVKKADDAPR
ncbi:MAG TPA: MFS transporter [Spirochaetes bacterium]|nr:MFS transporter [Spirochaetota bacterium]